jgi:ribosome-associated protein
MRRGKMITVNIREEEDFIRLGQALKKSGVVDSGVGAKIVIQNGLVKVNGIEEYQRGKKLHDGDIVTYEEETIQIVK